MSTFETRPRTASLLERAGIAPAETLNAAAPHTPLPNDPPLRTARVPAQRRNPLVALVHDGSAGAILDLVRDGMTAAVADSELALVLQSLPDEGCAPRLREFLRRYRPAGVVLLPPLCEREDLAVVCGVAQVPCVRLGPVSGQPGLACDERRAAADLVAWLVGQGHVRIGLVAGPETSPSARQRELGYLDAMADSGLDRGPALIVPGDDSFESGIEAGRLLLEISPRPTAIVAGNDEMAVGVLHAAAQAGVQVPSQLSVAGFDDTPLAVRALPALTSMRVPWGAMGAEAVRRIAAGAAPVPMAGFASELVARASVQPPPA